MDVRVGICEDDQHLRSVLARALQAEDFEVRVTGSGRDAVRVFSEHVPDLLVLDIGLPDADGRDVCQALRAHGVDAPVLFLTARGNLTDKLSAFVKVDNVFDRDPVAAPQTNTGIDINPLLYDTLGRVYRAGLRYNF